MILNLIRKEGSRMKDKLAKFMYGRYGFDEYGKFLSTTSLVFIVIGFLATFFSTNTNLFTLVGFLLLFYCYYRILSRKIHRRTQENYVFHGAKNEFVLFLKKFCNKFKQSKTHKVFKCPHCKQGLRVPKGRGKICITCSKCKHEFIRKS